MEQTIKKNEYDVYIKSLLTKKITLKITEIGKNVKANLTKKIVSGIEGKCIIEGFIRPSTVNIVSYSPGLIKDDHVEFQVVYMCLVCNPVKDLEILCVVRNVTKAGIHAHVVDEDENVPITVFIARDHHNMNPNFDTIKEADSVKAKIIGTRFELNDTSITAIASLI
jgi:DNA-directed RNA polymerase subunit E'/Rpb7|uniref:S1 motif domain-containing protein n=1 Tax=viral metagenome TaxID=1070528 RepID=A0A6C0B5D6_9ZZZZ